MDTVINGKHSVGEVSRPSIPRASKGPSHSDQRCYRLNVRVWLLYFIPSMSKQTKSLWNYIIKHTVLSGTQLTLKQQDLASLHNINNFGVRPQCYLFTVKGYYNLSFQVTQT